MKRSCYGKYVEITVLCQIRPCKTKKKLILGFVFAFQFRFLSSYFVLFRVISAIFSDDLEKGDLQKESSRTILENKMSFCTCFYLIGMFYSHPSFSVKLFKIL